MADIMMNSRTSVWSHDWRGVPLPTLVYTKKLNIESTQYREVDFLSCVNSARNGSHLAFDGTKRWARIDDDLT